MNVVTIDFETYWSSTFSLTHLSFVEYIKGAEFEVLSCAIKKGAEETQVVFGQDKVGEALRAIDWSNTACVAHNGNEFDFPLLVWVYDVHPKLFVDTLALSKPKHQSEVGGSLAKLSTQYNLQVKDSTILHNTKGKRLADFDLRELVAMANYNKIDTDNCYALFKEFRAADTGGLTDMRDIVKTTRWHQNELRLADMTARMICYPQLQADQTLLHNTAAQARQQMEEKLDALAEKLGLLDREEVRTHLASAPKFAAALRDAGATPPRKTSKTTGKETWAFAKTDPGFLELLEHDDPIVQALASTRLGVKSTLLETRIFKMNSLAYLMGGWMSVPLAYHAATTGRWGGRVWNPQNLPRINKKFPKLTDALRKALIAPPGYKIVVSDLSGIELRVNHYLWHVKSSLALYAADPKADLYKEFAAFLYNKRPEDVTEFERQVAKVAQLGLGFGAGAKTFRIVAKLMGGIDLTEAQAQDIVDKWRIKYREIVHGWTHCQRAIVAMHMGASFNIDPHGLVRVMDGRVVLPSGRSLYYPGLARGQDEKGRMQYKYGVGKNHSKLYSGLMDENIVQAIARDVIAEHALIIQAETGYRPALMVHDELVYVVPERDADKHLAQINEIMRRTPSWLPGIVLWSEGGTGYNYGAAK